MGEVTETWMLDLAGRRHEVVIRDRGIRRTVAWTVDRRPVAERTTTDERVILDGAGDGAVRVRLPVFTGPARRVTLFGGADDEGALAQAHAGFGGHDFRAVAGAAVDREAEIRAHPGRFVATRTALAVAAVLAAVFLIPILRRLIPDLSIPWPDIPWPDIPWPSIPWPDISLPSIPWPDIPWPDISLPAAPGWLIWIIEHAKYVAPVLIAAALAASEIRRRRVQDARAAERDRVDPVGGRRGGGDDPSPAGRDAGSAAKRAGEEPLDP